jgi:Nickel responsive protein SCO4226-like
MNTYVIRRKGNWSNAEEVKGAAARSARVGNEEMPDRVKWIRSYVVEEPDGRLGTLCIYQGADVEAVREHARRSGMTADEIISVADTVVIRDDPKPSGFGL